MVLFKIHKNVDRCIWYIENKTNVGLPILCRFGKVQNNQYSYAFIRTYLIYHNIVSNILQNFCTTTTLKISIL